MKKMIMAVLFILVANVAMAGQLRVAGYYDVIREQRTITLDGYNQLSKNWSTWGFVDFYTPQGNLKGQTDNANVDTFYGKGTVSYALWQINQHNTFKMTAELIDSSWGNSQLKPGLAWMISGDQGYLNFKVLPATIELVKPEIHIPQTGVVGTAWYLNLSDKLFWEGFGEMTFAYEGQTRYYPFIGETQLGYRLTDKVNALVEYRYNNFSTDDHGLGLGAEITFLKKT